MGEILHSNEAEKKPQQIYTVVSYETSTSTGSASVEHNRGVFLASGDNEAEILNDLETV